MSGESMEMTLLEHGRKLEEGENEASGGREGLGVRDWGGWIAYLVAPVTNHGAVDEKGASGREGEALGAAPGRM